MQPLPHHYCVSAAGTADGDVTLTAERVPPLRSASPAEFGGPGDCWSPEAFLVGAVADCFILTFRSVARASKLPWTSLHCDVTGTLDRSAGVTQFTSLNVHAHLAVPWGTDRDQAGRALEKAERGCLISNSLKATTHLQPEVDVAPQPLEDVVGVAH